MNSSVRYWQKVNADPARHYRGCEGKKHHPSRKVAMGVRRVMMQEATNEDEYRDAEKLESYRCGACKAWHTGHPPEWLVRQRELAARDEKIWQSFKQTEASH